MRRPFMQTLTNKLNGAFTVFLDIAPNFLFGWVDRFSWFIFGMGMFASLSNMPHNEVLTVLTPVKTQAVIIIVTLFYIASWIVNTLIVYGFLLYEKHNH